MITESSDSGSRISSGYARMIDWVRYEVAVCRRNSGQPVDSRILAALVRGKRADDAGRAAIRSEIDQLLGKSV